MVLYGKCEKIFPFLNENCKKAYKNVCFTSVCRLLCRKMTALRQV